MFKNILLVIGIIFCVYLGIATFFPEGAFVGSIGKYLGNVNRFLFGYLGFFYPLILAFLLPFVFKNKETALRSFEISLALLLFFVDLLIIQANVVNSDLHGYVGFSIVEMLQGFIGSAGIWLFILMIAALSFIVFIDFEIQDAFDKLIEIKDNYSFAKKPVKLSKKDTQKKDIQSYKLTKKEQPKNLYVKKDELQNEVSSLELNTDIVLEEIEAEIVEEKPKSDPKPQHVKVLSEVEENKKLLETLEKGEAKKPKDFRLPTLKFLADEPRSGNKVSESEIDQKISDLLEKLKRFKIDGDVVRTYAGPVVTTFEFRPAPHIKVSKILTLQDDLAMALKAQTIRIQAPVPGKDVVGIEIPNKNIDTIYLKSILDSKVFKNSASELTIALGKDIVGNPFVTDLKKLPHLLIAGTTGSGKSVGINAMLLSLLYRNSPKTLRLLMIDPKMLEFSMYNDIPHLLTPVITQSKEAVSALANMVTEMERRYQVMSQSKTKNIESYNEKATKEGLANMPYIVVIIDELADLMMTSGKDVELYIARLAQMARAAGIHLLVATQRPSVDVVTGLIKANLPSRISFKVGSKVDSKVILDSYGAESLLGRGDMLFTPPSIPGAIRLHAPFASEKEIETVVEYLKTQGEPDYDKSYLKDPNSSESSGNGDFDSGDIDELYEDAKSIVLNDRKTSISYIQRRLQIGYNRAARIVEQLEKMGVLTPANSKGQRDIVS